MREWIIRCLPPVFFIFPEIISEPRTVQTVPHVWVFESGGPWGAGIPWSNTLSQMTRSQQGGQQITTVEIRIASVQLYSLNDPGWVSWGPGIRWQTSGRVEEDADWLSFWFTLCFSNQPSEESVHSWLCELGSPRWNTVRGTDSRGSAPRFDHI